MTWRATIWSAKCLAFSLLGIVVCGQATRSINPPLWWVLHRTQATYLDLLLFQFLYFFQLRALYGLLLGLVPIRFCIEALRTMHGMLRNPGPAPQTSEVDWRRPILWAWAPLALIFLVRFATWQSPNQSILAAPDHFERLKYFFNPMQIASRNFLNPETRYLVFDMVTITGPMIFMLAYTTGVWLRHQFPDVHHPARPLSDPPEEQAAELP
jgi:hypothetical protein